MSDFNLLIKIRNGRMLRKMREHGHYTAASLSRATGVTQSEIGKLLMLKEGPICKKSGDVRKGPLKICEALNATMLDLWPPSMCEYRAPKTNVEVDLSLEQVAGLLDQDQDHVLAIENKEVLGRLKAVLSPRELLVIDGRYRGDTLREIGLQLGVKQERIRQLEARAHRKMRDKATRLGLTRAYRNEQSDKEVADMFEAEADKFGTPAPGPSAATQKPSPSTMHYPSNNLIELKARLDQESVAIEMAALRKEAGIP